MRPRHVSVALAMLCLSACEGDGGEAQKVNDPEATFADDTPAETAADPSGAGARGSVGGGAPASGSAGASPGSVGGSAGAASGHAAAAGGARGGVGGAPTASQETDGGSSGAAVVASAGGSTPTAGSSGTFGSAGGGTAPTAGTAGRGGSGRPGPDAGPADPDVDAGIGTATPLGPFDYPIDPEALVGCRAPDEPGCAECCIQMEDGRCDYRNDQDTNWGDFDVDPWYLGRHIEDDPCPDTCSPCASCFRRTEEGLREREVRPDCDCDNVASIADACFAPASCECYCPGALAEMDACPAAE